MVELEELTIVEDTDRRVDAENKIVIEVGKVGRDRGGWAEDSDLLI